MSPECTTAANAVFSNIVCTTALNDDDSDTLCSATCRPLFETVVRLCPPNTLVRKFNYSCSIIFIILC